MNDMDMAIIFLSFNLNLLKVDTLEATDVIDLSDGQRDKNNQIFNIFEKKKDSEQITVTIVTLALLIAKCQTCIEREERG
jgi:hypothetical protein